MSNYFNTETSKNPLYKPNIEDLNALKININYDIDVKYKYIPFVIYPNEAELLGYYQFTISTNGTNSNCLINIKINIFKDDHNVTRIHLVNYEVIKSDDNIYISRIHLDTDDNILIIWLLNRTEYITKNLSETLIMYPDFETINTESKSLSFIYGDDGNVLKDGSIYKFELPLYETVYDDNFKKNKFNYLDSNTIDIAIKNNVSSVEDKFNIVFRDVTTQITQIKNKLEEYGNNIQTNEMITTDRVDKTNKDEYLDGKIVESYVPLLFKLPDTNAVSELKIIGIKDTTNYPINFWTELKITKFSKNIFVDISYRQDQKYIAHMCIDQTNSFLIIWLKRFMVYNFSMLNINFDKHMTEESVNNTYPELKPNDLNRLNSTYFNNSNLADNNMFTLNLTTMPLLIVKKAN